MSPSLHSGELPNQERKFFCDPSVSWFPLWTIRSDCRTYPIAPVALFIRCQIETRLVRSRVTSTPCSLLPLYFCLSLHSRSLSVFLSLCLFYFLSLPLSQSRERHRTRSPDVIDVTSFREYCPFKSHFDKLVPSQCVFTGSISSAKWESFLSLSILCSTQSEVFSRSLCLLDTGRYDFKSFTDPVSDIQLYADFWSVSCPTRRFQARRPLSSFPTLFLEDPSTFRLLVRHTRIFPGLVRLIFQFVFFRSHVNRNSLWSCADLDQFLLCFFVFEVSFEVSKLFCCTLFLIPLMSASLYPGDLPNQARKLLCCPSVSCFPCELSHQIEGRIASLQLRSSFAVSLNHVSFDFQFMSDCDNLFPSPCLPVFLSFSLSLSLSLCCFLSLALSLSLSFSLSLCLLFFLSLSRERHRW